jgi:hypothetical protein
VDDLARRWLGWLEQAASHGLIVSEDRAKI